MRIELLLAGAAVLGGIGASIAARVDVIHAQKAERGTQQWTISINSNAAVVVIDTAGVCLYVYDAIGSRAGIAAVAKTQLPQGTGCQ